MLSKKQYCFNVIHMCLKYAYKFFDTPTFKTWSLILIPLHVEWT